MHELTIWEHFANFFDILFEGTGNTPGLNDIGFFGVSIIGWIFGCLVASALVHFIIKVSNK